MKQTLLYVEEVENHFVRVLIERNDINLILLRFRQNMNFHEEHLKKTAYIPTFVLDKKAPIESECDRFLEFLTVKGLNVDYFFNDSEYNQEYAQQFARYLRLPGALLEEQACTVRDKVLMKEFIRRIGYECMDYMPLMNRKDAICCAEKWGWPIIIKWRRCVSSIEVYKVNSEQELDLLKLDYSSGRYMAECFCSDKIWCIDAIVSKGKVAECLYTWLPYTNLEFAENKKRFVQLAFGKRPDSWKFNPRNLLSDIIDALELVGGYLHLEAFITDKGEAIICEFAWRTPGDHMLSNFSILFKKSIPDILIDAILEKPLSSLEKTDGCVGDVFLPVFDGEIMNISTIGWLGRQVNIIDGEMYYKTGDKVKTRHKYTDCSGWIQIKAASSREAMRMIDCIYEKFYIQMR